MTNYILNGYAVSFNDSGTELTSFDFATLHITATEGVSSFTYTIDSSQPGYLPVVNLDTEGLQLSIDGELLSDMEVEIRLGEVEWGGGNSTVLLNFETPEGLIYSFDLTGDPVDFSSPGGFQSFLSSFTEVGPASGAFGEGSDVPLGNTLGFPTVNDTWYGTIDGEFWDGGSGADALYAGGGDDEVHGGTGDDHIRGSRGADTLHGEEGTDLITGGGDCDMIYGGGDDDDLRGGRGRDVIEGNGGQDRIDGGPGRDTLTGGVNQDTFVFVDNIDRDTITDFRAGADTVQIDEDIYGGGLTQQELVDTYGTFDGDGNFVLDFSGGDTSPGADAIAFEGITDGNLIVDDIELI